MRRIILFLTLTFLVMPASAVEVSRSKVDHPALGTAGGAALHSSIEAIFTKLGDNANSRYNEFSGIADSTTVEVDHNFGVNLDQLNVLIYTGSGSNLTRVPDPLTQSPPWNIVEKTGSEKTVIEVTTPSSGGPHTFAVVTIHGKGSEKLNDLSDVDVETAAPEDGQALVFDNGTSTWIPGASGDSSFKIQSIVGVNATIKSGGIDVSPGKQIATYDGTGSASTDFDSDLLCDLDAVLGSSPADDTTYILYVDMDSLAAPITTTDTGEKLYPVTCNNFVLLTDFPDSGNVLTSRYVHIGNVHSADTGNSWSAAGSAFNTFFFRDHGRPIVNTSPVVYSLGEQAIGSVGSTNQIVAGHTLQTDSFGFAFADDIAFFNLQADPNDDSGATSCGAGASACDLTNNGSTPFTGTNIFGVSGSADLNGSSQYFSSTDSYFDPGDTDYTFFAWIKADDYTPGSSQYLFSQGNASGDQTLEIFLESTSGDFVFRAADTATTFNAFTIEAENNSFTDNVDWVHIAFVHDSINNLAKIYLQGSEKISASTSAPPRNSSTDQFFVGVRDVAGLAGYFSGQFQEFGLVKKVLSAEEIRKLASYRIDHNQNVATAEQNWIATFSNGLKNQLDNGWIVDKSANSIWFDFLDLASTDQVALKLKNENATSHVIPLKTFDTGLLSSAPSFPLSHGLGSVPTAVEVIHEGQTTAGDFDDVKNLCSWDDTQITCTGLNTVDGTHRLRIVMSAANVAASITEATATDSGIVTTGTQTFGGDKTIAGTLTVEPNDSGTTANSTADDLIVEQNTAGGMSILTPDASNGSIFFGSPSDPVGAALQWNHDGNLLILESGKAGAALSLRSGNGTEALRIKSDQEILHELPDTSFKLNDTDGVDPNMIIFQNAGTDYGTIGTTSGNDGGLRISAPATRDVGIVLDGQAVLWADGTDDEVEISVPTDGQCSFNIGGTVGNVCSGNGTGLTLTNVAGFSSLTFDSYQYMRVGRVISFSFGFRGAADGNRDLVDVTLPSEIQGVTSSTTPVGGSCGFSIGDVSSTPQSTVTTGADNTKIRVQTYSSGGFAAGTSILCNATFLID